MRRVLLAGTLMAVACRQPERETRFLNFDPASGAGALQHGWSSFERGPEGDTFVWSTAREAGLAVSSAADGDRLVRFRCWPFWFAGAPEQRMQLTLNGTVIETVPLQPDRRVYSVYVPRGAWRAGANELNFSFSYTARPQDHGGADSRALAVAFDWLEIVPPPRP